MYRSFEKGVSPNSGLAIGFAFIIASHFLVIPTCAYGYSEDYEGNLGDTINLHGVSYIGTQVYLFLCGPGLPENGVTLTDVSARADQGHFTIVEVNSDQTWSMKWNTGRIEHEINPGTYTVYVSNEPVDKSGLSGNNYQALTVYLKDSDLSSSGTSVSSPYVLRPEEHISTPKITQSPASASPSVPDIPAPVAITSPPTNLPSPTKAALSLAIIVFTLFAMVCIRSRQ